MIREDSTTDNQQRWLRETEQMKDFMIGRLRDGVIANGDNYYSSQTGRTRFDQSSTKERWIFSFFPRHFCIDREIIVFQSDGIRLSLLLRSINRLYSFFSPGSPFSFPRGFINPRASVFRVCGNKNTVSSSHASSTTINYRVPGIIRRKPLRVLIKPVIQPLDFRRLKTAVPIGTVGP